MVTSLCHCANADNSAMKQWRQRNNAWTSKLGSHRGARGSILTGLHSGKIWILLFTFTF